MSEENYKNDVKRLSNLMEQENVSPKTSPREQYDVYTRIKKHEEKIADKVQQHSSNTRTFDDDPRYVCREILNVIPESE